MQSTEHRFDWLKSGLLWRTFILLAVLITASMAAGIASIQMVERKPQAEQLAAQVVSVVTITRAALTHSAPDLRRELLFDLASNEGLRIYLLEKSDVLGPPPDVARMAEFQQVVKDKLGAKTKFAGMRNGVPGFWVSFRLDDDDSDEYWLMFERGRLVRAPGLRWLGWTSIVLLLALLGAVYISRLINLPLARLTAATHAIAQGRQPDPLPEAGPAEVSETNRAFNQMVADLNRIESDRALILAGISHDLRTPLARMQLEVEMAGLLDDARRGMQGDLAQMDAIIGQFLDYAKPTDAASFTPVDLSQLVQETGWEFSRQPDLGLTFDIEPGVRVLGHPTDLKRVLANLIENARKYGKSVGVDGDQVADITLSCRLRGADGRQRAVVTVADRGPGVPEAEMELLRKPFTRLDTARSQANGAGLGLAIVDRIVARHGAQLHMRAREGGGFEVEIVLEPLKTA
jgi:two-component system osmolarity sensor histidine kinase EnvZ